MNNSFQSGYEYGKRMGFNRYMKMLVRFTDGRIPLNPCRASHQFITGAYRGYLVANPGCSIR